MSGSVRLDPGASGRGLSLTLSPAWGADSSGVDRLWSLRDTAGLAANENFDATGRLDTEIGYGLAGPDGLGVVTPYAGLALSDGNARIWRLGSRWTLGPGLSLNLDGTRREAAQQRRAGAWCRAHVPHAGSDRRRRGSFAGGSGKIFRRRRGDSRAAGFARRDGWRRNRRAWPFRLPRILRRRRGISRKRISRRRNGRYARYARPAPATPPARRPG